MDPLTQIGLRAGTDKASFHGYTKYYHDILNEFRDKELFFIELGFGGYDWPDTGGESVRMWTEYAPKWDIAVIDIFEKHQSLVPPGVKFYRGSQDDRHFLEQIISSHGEPTIIIDDASHNSSLTIASFEILWTHLKSGGWYIVEDIGTSYQEDMVGGPGTAIHTLCKSNVDFIMANSPHGKDNDVLSGIRDAGIDAMYVIPNAIGLRKK